MSDQTSIFPENSSPNPAPTPANSNDQLVTMLASIKNENGEPKYKSVEDALKALQHSQAYIPQLTQSLAAKEAELAQARQGLTKVEELERAVQQLMNPSSKEPEPKPAPAAIDPSSIAEIVNRTLNENRTKELANANISKVVQTVKQLYGDKSEEMFYGKAASLGLSKEAVNTLAATSPDAVYSMLGISNAPGQSKPLSGFNSDGFQPPKETFISKNPKPALIGASSQDLLEEGRNARKMVEELNAQGLSISALTDPKVYFKHFK